MGTRRHLEGFDEERLIFSRHARGELSLDALTLDDVLDAINFPDEVSKDLPGGIRAPGLNGGPLSRLRAPAGQGRLARRHLYRRHRHGELKGEDMPVRPTTYQTQQRGVRITLTDVPTTFSDDGEELGFALGVMRQLDALVQEALAQAPEGGAVELAYAETVPPPDPVSLELRRAMRLRRMSGAQMAQQLGVTPPVVSRWLSPDYHQHGMETLRRIANILDMDLEVKLTPRERKTAS